MIEGRLAFIQHSPLELPGALGHHAILRGFGVHTFRADRGSLPDPEQFDAIVVMGSVSSVNDPDLDWVAPEREFVGAAVGRQVPVLGVCFGGQLLAQVLGASVGAAPTPEVGWSPVRTEDPDIVPAGPWLLWHEEAFTLPPGATPVARTDGALQAFVHGHHLGLQFHPEVTPALVDRWVEEADGRGHITEEEGRALSDNLDALATGSTAQAGILLDGFLRRAGLLA